MTSLIKRRCEGREMFKKMLGIRGGGFEINFNSSVFLEKIFFPKLLLVRSKH